MIEISLTSVIIILLICAVGHLVSKIRTELWELSEEVKKLRDKE